ncbi:hypothetical protein KRX19_08390 [Cardiobacteriaceae bacterium TAE3-ERU3]|nr:hypothetical protein [Cardiobacteriaceae bacterium TAE3-ERU3]
MSEHTTINRSGAIKAIIGSLIGILVFFIPLPTGDGGSKIPLVSIIGAVKGAVSGVLPYVVLLILFLLCVSWLLFLRKQPERLQKFHRKDNWLVGTLFIIALFIDILLVFNIGPDWLLNKDVGGLVLYLSGSVLLTVTIAGFFVVFLTEFGFLEFLGTLLEPLMRPLYRLPGNSAVDAITSFVSAAAVGIFFTNRLYERGTYTQREAAAVASSFSICSLGFFAVLADTANIIDYLPYMIIVSFIVNFLLAAIMVRIPPLSRKKDIYIDGSKQDLSQREEHHDHIFVRACKAAAARGAKVQMKDMWRGGADALGFGVKIVAYVVSIATIALLIATYTETFNYLGKIVEPYIALMQLPNPEAIAPTVLISISEILLPAVLIAGSEASQMAAFFVCTLTTVQIIFFTESANAMLESSIPLKLIDLLVIFLLRTLIGIPLVALATHIIF